MSMRVVDGFVGLIKRVPGPGKRWAVRAQDLAEHFIADPRKAVRLAEPLFQVGRQVNARLTNPDGTLDLTRVHRVLVVRLDELGDLVLTTPLLRELRRMLPTAHITLLVKPALHNLVERCPYLDEVQVYDWSHKPGRRALKLAAQKLWLRRYDLAIVPRWDIDYYYGAVVSYLSGATMRIGYSERVSLERVLHDAGNDALFTQAVADRTLRHETERGLELLRQLGGDPQDSRLELWSDAEDERVVTSLLAEHGVAAEEPLLACAPGAGEAKRIWPTTSMAEVGRCLATRYGARIVLIGGPGEEALAEPIHAAVGAATIDAIGRLTLRQTAALLRRCRLLVCNDSGPMHMGAAVGVPILAISCHPLTGLQSHYNSPLRFGPWGVPNRVLQPPGPTFPCSIDCSSPDAHCITQVSVAQVQTAAAELLHQLPVRQPEFPAAAERENRTILMVTHVVPYPPSAGNEVRVHNLLCWLKEQGFAVALLVHAQVSQQQQVELRKHVAWLYVDSSATEALPTAPNLPPRRRLETLQDIFCPPSVVIATRRLVQRHQPMAVISEYIWMSRCLQGLPADVCKIIDTHDVYARRNQTVAAHGISDVLSISSSEEAQLLRRADVILAIQNEEQKILEALVSDREVLTVPIDFALPPAPASPRPPVPGRLLFVGSDNEPNLRGLQDFVAQAWPAIKQRHPGARLRIVGRVTQRADFAADPTIESVGYVADLSAEYAQAEVLLNPVFAGSGLKVKTLEALTFARPVMSWPSGVEGMGGAAPCLVAYSWAEFAEQTIELLGNEALREELSRRARDFIATHYAKDVVYGALHRRLEACSMATARSSGRD